MGQHKTRANSRDKLLFQATDKQLFDKQTMKEMKSLFTVQKLPGKRGGGGRGRELRGREVWWRRVEGGGGNLL